MRRQSIRHESDDAENLFLKLTGARPSDDQRKGDAIVTVKGKDYYVEVKQCDAPAGRAGTLNQIRAIKFTPLVVYNDERREWYVASPIRLLRLVSDKTRGQHNEIAYECSNLSLSQIESEATADHGLREAVERACLEAEAHSQLREVMEELHSDLRELAKRYQHRVREFLQGT